MTSMDGATASLPGWFGRYWRATAIGLVITVIALALMDFMFDSGVLRIVLGVVWFLTMQYVILLILGGLLIRGTSSGPRNGTVRVGGRLC